jgi:phosphate/sulfate permease
MEKDLGHLRGLGPILVGALIGIDAAAAVLTVFFAELLEWAWIKPFGFVLLVASGLTLVAAGGFYIVLQQHLADDEILAGTGGQAQGEPDS